MKVRSLSTYSTIELDYIKANHWPFYSAIFEVENGRKPEPPKRSNNSGKQAIKGKLEDYSMSELELLKAENPLVYRMLFSNKYGYDPMPKSQGSTIKSLPKANGNSKLEDYSMSELELLKAENPMVYRMLFSNKYGYDPMPKSH